MSMLLASDKLPRTWNDTRAHSDIGVLRASANVVVSASPDDTLVSFSIQPSIAAAISDIYAAAYSLETDLLIAPVGKVSTRDYGMLGLSKGGVVSLRIPEATISRLASSSGLSTVRLALIAPKPSASEATSRLVSDSVLLVLDSAFVSSQGMLPPLQTNPA
ncbi:hypothetical protein GGI04_000277 [Coemansia thaxteri]|nr:hypothetical protein GGI04_000277 [Coemansia thaxteri]KAJ2475460.1 hypothetical protein EV174_005269 [Coemansia sp. RSA 2320]